MMIPFFQAALARMPGVLFVARSASGAIVAASPDFRAMLEIPSADAALPTVEALCVSSDSDRLRHALRSLEVSADEVVTTQFSCQARPESSITWALSMIRAEGASWILGRAVLDDCDEASTGGVGVGWEQIVERARIAFLQAERGRAFDRLLSDIAHEINNPNHYMMLNLHWLIDLWGGVTEVLDRHAETHPAFQLANMPYAEVREEVPAILQETLAGVERVSDLIAKLRRVIRSERATRVEVDLNALVGSVVELLQAPLRACAARTEVRLTESLPRVKGDRQQLELMIINVVLEVCRVHDDQDSPLKLSTIHDRRAGRLVMTVEYSGEALSSTETPAPFFGGQSSDEPPLDVAVRIAQRHDGSLDLSARDAVRLELSLTDR